MNNTNTKIENACKLVARTFYGPQGLWLYEAFGTINELYFGNELPYPLIRLALTPHGKSLGYCRAGINTSPEIVIHPSTFGGTESENPWGIPASWLGERYAFDVLLHECIHLSVHYRLGGHDGLTSHNNKKWVSEVNRLAPLLGFNDVAAGMSKIRRVPTDGELTRRGKQPTKVERYAAGNVPYEAICTFPYALRVHLGSADSFYRNKESLFVTSN